jgi:hypothetical protein
MEKIVHVIMWLFVGALVVLVVTHASGFATAVNAVGGQVTNDAGLLSGTGVSTTTSNTGTTTKVSAAKAAA